MSFNSKISELRYFNSHKISCLDETGVLENFKDENGQFFCNSSGEEEQGRADKRVRSMLSLFRASNISFPGEKVMDEAKTFTREYLNQVLTGEAVTDVDQSLLSEVSCKQFFKLMRTLLASAKVLFYCMLCTLLASAKSYLISIFQVKYALEFPWHCSLPRWEARSFIEIYKQNN